MSIYKSNYRCKRSDVDNTVSLDIVLENKNGIVLVVTPVLKTRTYVISKN